MGVYLYGVRRLYWQRLSPYPLLFRTDADRWDFYSHSHIDLGDDISHDDESGF